jgi:hypothetical protein
MEKSNIAETDSEAWLLQVKHEGELGGGILLHSPRPEQNGGLTSVGTRDASDGDIEIKLAIGGGNDLWCAAGVTIRSKRLHIIVGGAAGILATTV